jgi:hypothetical protein
MNCYLINSSDGHKFAVGCECVRKTGDAGLVNKQKALKRQAERDKRAAARQAAYERELEKQRESAKKTAGLQTTRYGRMSKRPNGARKSAKPGCGLRSWGRWRAGSETVVVASGIAWPQLSTRVDFLLATGGASLVISWRSKRAVVVARLMRLSMPRLRPYSKKQKKSNKGDQWQINLYGQ